MCRKPKVQSPAPDEPVEAVYTLGVQSLHLELEAGGSEVGDQAGEITCKYGGLSQILIIPKSWTWPRAALTLAVWAGGAARRTTGAG